MPTRGEGDQATWRWAACAWYFFQCASEVFIGPFINLYLQSQGLSEQQIGIVGAILPWAGVVASFAWGLVADYFQAHRMLIVLLQILSSIARVPIPFTSSFSGLLLLTVANRIFGSPVTAMADAAVNSACTEDGEYGRYRLYGAIGWGGFSAVAGLVSNAYGIRASLVMNLLLVVPCVVLSWYLYLPTTTTAAANDADSAAAKRAQLRKAGKDSFSHIDDHELAPLPQSRGPGFDSTMPEGCDVELHIIDRENNTSLLLGNRNHQRWEAADSKAGHGDFGREGQGRLGTASGQPKHLSPGRLRWPLEGQAHQEQLLGSCRQCTGTLPSSRTDQAPPAGISSTSQPGPVSATLPCPSAKPGALSESEPAAAVSHLSFLAKLWLIFSRPECLVFFWTATVMGFGMGMIDCYLFLLLKEMGAADVLLGLTLTITCVAEVPVFQLQGWMMQRLGSADALMDVSLAAYTVRMMYYAVLPMLGTPWLVLPVELLHGLTFGCGWGAGCEKCRALAPPGLEATQQGIFQSLYFGLGTGLGALLGGVLAQYHGYQAAFFWGDCVVVLGWLVSMLGRLLVLRGARTKGPAYAAVAVAEG